ncbi:phage terminase large subunit family protein [Jiella pelagia]|uniref:Phage terminase large subunit family protein n=1 Tax=Jiella pelagia TaxID=2986949 RepID=A0ABY7C1Z0_9HYPH|nr:phage terminase large subunit family protein [Jiella pelagia]WAP69049.1 phage terminase large subunit family protein [Jiella pelagia]
MLADGAAVYRKGFLKGLRPDPVWSVSQWADDRRFLSQKASSEPGRWKTARTPYLGEIMDSLSPHEDCEMVVVMAGAQLGKSESGFNWIGYVVDVAPGPMLMVQPTVETAKRVSKQRIDALFEESPALRAKIKPPRERDSGNTVFSKEFPGGILILTGANSAVGLRSMPARYLFMDEVDGYPGDVDGEGDPVNLAMARTRTFARRKVLLTSTPTISGRSRIEAAYEDSDRRRYHVPCPECGHKAPILWRNIKWEKGNPETARLACEECGCLIPEHRKTQMLAGGEWVAENPGHRTRGFHISSLYSPVGWYSWEQAVREWESCQGNQERLRTFVNTVLGETWADRGESPDWVVLWERSRGGHERSIIPEGGCLLTAGMDVQADRLELELVAWGKSQQSWSVDYRQIFGDTAGDEVWAKADDLLDEVFTSEVGIDFAVRGLGVDTGFQTQRVYHWARFSRHKERIFLLKGQDSLAMPVGTARGIDMNWRGQRHSNGARVYPVGVSLLKDELYGRLKMRREPGAEDYPTGWCFFPEYDEEYFKMLTAEEKVAKLVKGYRRYQWEKTRDRNEALDCRVYSRAVAAILGADKYADADWDSLTSAAPRTTAANDNNGGDPWIQRRRGNWINR